MNRNRTRWIYPTVAIALLIFSGFILRRELDRYSLEDLAKGVALIGDRQLSFAFALTIIDYLVISSYDFVAFHQLNRYLDSKRILFTTFITYAVSNTTGFTLLIGGGIRYRFYSFWGVPPRIIAKIIALGNLTFWLGLSTLGGITFLVNPLQLPKAVNLPTATMRYLGIVALIVVGIYLYFCWQRKSLKIDSRIFRFPKPITSLSQIAVFTGDWALAAGVLYCLIPAYPDRNYLQFFSIYLLGMAASIISNIPGGIGVFETVIIFLLPRSIFTADLLSSLLVYRSIRFLIPLAIALILLCCFELRQRWYAKQQKNK